MIENNPSERVPKGFQNSCFAKSATPAPAPANETAPSTSNTPATHQHQHLATRRFQSVGSGCVNLSTHVTATGLRQKTDGRGGYCCDICRRDERE